MCVTEFRLQRAFAHPELPRFYVCQGLHSSWAVLDQMGDVRVVEFEDSTQAIREAARRNAAEPLRILPADADPPPRFAAAPRLEKPPAMPMGCPVMQGSDCVAVARSHTMAKRIARALNQMNPNRRGC